MGGMGGAKATPLCRRKWHGTASFCRSIKHADLAYTLKESRHFRQLISVAAMARKQTQKYFSGMTQIIQASKKLLTKVNVYMCKQFTADLVRRID